LKVHIAVVAEKVTRSERGNMSIEGIFNTMFAPSYPARHPGMAILIRLLYYKSEVLDTAKRVAFKFVDADGLSVFEFRSDTEFPPVPEGETWAIWDHELTLTNFPIDAAGEYSIDFFFGSDKLIGLPVLAKVVALSPSGDEGTTDAPGR